METIIYEHLKCKPDKKKQEKFTVIGDGIIYLNWVTKWCKKIEASSLARSSPGHNLCPPPNGVKLPLMLISLSCKRSSKLKC